MYLLLFRIILEAQSAKELSGAISLTLPSLVDLRIGWGRGWAGSWRTRCGVCRISPAADSVRPHLALMAVTISCDFVNLAMVLIVAIATIACPLKPDIHVNNSI